MKIHAEVLIESVEQAEALPEDTPVLIKVDGGVIGLEFARDLLPEHMTPVHHARHYALMPIEAETEYSTEESERRWSFDGVYDTPENVRRDRWDGTMRERSVTEWRDLA